MCGRGCAGWDERDGERVFTFACSKVMFVCLSVCMRIFMCLSENECVWGWRHAYIWSVCVCLHMKVKL